MSRTLAPDRPQGNQPGDPQNQPSRSSRNGQQGQQNAPVQQGPLQTVGPKLISQELFEEICDDVTVDNASDVERRREYQHGERGGFVVLEWNHRGIGARTS